MRHLNYSHLQYFWLVAREGSIARAAEVLHLTPQTISGQLKLLESAIGEPLFDRVGRRLVLTAKGQVILSYADEIFSIGSELANVVRGSQPGMPQTVSVGVVSTMAKLIGQRILAPVLKSDNPPKIRCHEAPLEHLLGELAVHRLDMVISDQPMIPGLSLRVYNHLLGQSGLSFFARREDAHGFRDDFPQSLHDAPMLLPAPNSALRRRLDDWFEESSIAPRIVGEFDDSAFLKAFGEAGCGLFVTPSVIEEEV
ncbi:MAG: LysR family transcriptional regulator, partial [Pseudomonadota bacterium]